MEQHDNGKSQTAVHPLSFILSCHHFAGLAGWLKGATGYRQKHELSTQKDLDAIG